MSTILAYDFGTTSLKAAVVTTAGIILGECNASYRIHQPAPTHAEQDPAELWAVACRAGRSALMAAGLTAADVAGAVFVAPWKNVIAVDTAGHVLHPSITWLDGRAGAEAAQLREDLPEYEGTGQDYWPRLMWLKRHRPDVWSATDKVMGLATYLRWRATDVFVTEPSDDFIRSGDPNRDASLQLLLEAAGLDEDVAKFPPSIAATDQVGTMTAVAAGDLGLLAGIPVFGGFSDLPAIAVGAGRSTVGSAHIYFGTSSWFAMVTAQGSTVRGTPSFTLDAQRDAVLYPLQTGCLAYDWIVEQTYGAEKAHLDDGIQAVVNADVAEIEAGSSSLLATHWLNGELPPLSKNAQGLFVNLTTRHDRRHMVRAVMESICYSHRSSIERHTAATGQEIHRIRVVGGGASSDVWMQMLADVLQIVVEAPQRPRSTGVLGAAACAAVGLGLSSDLEDGIAGRPPERVFQPDPENAAVYDKLFGIYLQLYPALASVFDQLNGPA